MKKVASWAAAEITKESSEEDDGDKHRGRIQIQNNTNLKAGLTVSWASPYPPSKADGLMALKMLETELSKVNKKMYKRLKQCGAFDRVIRFIKNAPVDGYDNLSIRENKSITCPSQYNGERIDIQIFKGRAFVGY